MQKPVQPDISSGLGGGEERREEHLHCVLHGHGPVHTGGETGELGKWRTGWSPGNNVALCRLCSFQIALRITVRVR